MAGPITPPLSSKWSVIGSGMINAIIVATIGAVVLLLILGFFRRGFPHDADIGVGDF
jgi:uncharacterized membrane protein YeaQ/YmgE (transglycosylase-associated protein family)